METVVKMYFFHQTFFAMLVLISFSENRMFIRILKFESAKNFQDLKRIISFTENSNSIHHPNKVNNFCICKLKPVSEHTEYFLNVCISHM